MKDPLRKIPGFRSGKLWKSVLATIFYFFYLITGLGMYNPTPIDLLLKLIQRLIPLFIVWIVVFNFNDLKSRLPLFRTKKIIPSVLAVVILVFITPISIFILDEFKTPEYLENVRANANKNSIEEESPIVETPEEPTDNSSSNQLSKAEEEARIKAEQEAIARKEALEKAKVLRDARENPALLSEEEYKNLCSDVPWAEVVDNPDSSEGKFLKKNLMVRQIATDPITDELVYICGEEKSENVYTGGTFNVYDRRIDTTHEIKLYDKIYVYGVIDKVYKSWSAPQPDLYIGYLEYLGKFPEN